MKGDRKFPVANLLKAADRRVKCTHMTMKRVFDHDGTLTCPRCGGSPCFGWIYACTEDELGCMENEQAPNNVAASENPRSPQSTPSDPSLSDWVVKAIEQGHYTEEQVGILLAQRANAVETARAQALPSTNSDSTIDQSSAGVTLKEPINNSPRPIAKWTTSPKPIQDTAAKELPSPATSKCRLMLCHFCHPAGCDRSWLSLDKFCSTMAELDVPFKNIFEIPASVIPRVPLSSVKKAINQDGGSESVQPIEGTDAQPGQGSTSYESPAGNGDESGENKASVLHRQRMRAFEARLRTSQHWSHIGLHESLARQDLAMEPGWKRNPPRRKVSPRRPVLIRRPKWTMDMKHRTQDAMVQGAGS